MSRFLVRMFQLRQEYGLTSNDEEKVIDLVIVMAVEARHYLIDANLEESKAENIQLAYSELGVPSLEELVIYVVENRGLEIMPLKEDFWSRHPNYQRKPVNWNQGPL